MKGGAFASQWNYIIILEAEPSQLKKFRTKRADETGNVQRARLWGVVVSFALICEAMYSILLE